MVRDGMIIPSTPVPIPSGISMKVPADHPYSFLIVLAALDACERAYVEQNGRHSRLVLKMRPFVVQRARETQLRALAGR